MSAKNPEETHIEKVVGSRSPDSSKNNMDENLLSVVKADIEDNKKETNEKITKTIKDDSNDWIHITFPKVSIHLKTLRGELRFSNLFKFVLNWPTSSWKNLFFCLALTFQELGPSIWDIGTDIYQGKTYLNGDTYTKTVNSRNDSSIMMYDCKWVGTTRTATVINNIESDIGFTYTFECIEK